MSSNRVHRGWRGLVNVALLATVVIGAVHLGVSEPVSAWDLRVGTRTRLTSAVRVQGTRVSVDGTLRDNVGQGIPGMGVSIDFERVRGSTGVIRRDVVTDRTGRYYVGLTLPAGEYKGTVHYTGQQYYFEGSEVDLGTIRTERGTVELGLRHAPVARRHWTIQGAVAAVSGGEPVEGLPIEVSVGEVPLQVETGGSGTASFPVDLTETRGPWMELTARLIDARDFHPASTSGRVRVIDGPALSVEAENVRARLQRGLQIEGAFNDRYGGIGGQTVTLVVSSAGLERARLQAVTEEDGAYSFFVAEDQLPEGVVSVEAVVSLARGESVVAPAATVRIDKTGGAGLLWVIGGVVGLCFVVVAAFGARDLWRRRRKTQAERPPRTSAKQARQARIVALDPAERPPSVAAAPAEALTGVLWDGQTDKPIVGGRVELFRNPGSAVELTSGLAPDAVQVTDARGYFEFPVIEPGSWVMQGRARGYVMASHRFSAPHRGRLSYFRFPLTPVRVVVRDLYTELVEDLSRQNAAWGRLTPRQVYRLLIAAVERVVAGQALGPSSEGLEAFRTSLAALLEATRGERGPLGGAELVETFTHVIEEVYFSQRMHEESIIAISERLAAAIRKLARERGPGAMLEVDDEEVA